MTTNTTEKDAEALAAFLSQDDAALFIGSGVSLWSGLPSWSTLIHGLIDYAAAQGVRVGMAQSALRDGRLADAADALDLPSLEIANVLRSQMGFDTAQPHAIHGLLTRLGPQRFITTNYDTLIEQQLGLEARLGQFRTVTATRVAEMADILKARADRFIFKPHGDIGDAATMVLSARDYERVMLGGRNLIRHGLETLLVSRPILFLGFGLRDPDLNLILRSLTDSYRGNIHHLYAIVADLSEEERDYWRERFRIRAFGYPVRTDMQGRRSHDALLDLLKSIIAQRSGQSAKSRPQRIPLPTAQEMSIGPKARLSRYAASLVRDSADNSIDLCGHLHQQWQCWPDDHINCLNGLPLREIVEKCPISMILVGGAGSGKSRAFADYLSHSAERLLVWQSQEPGASPPSIPVLLDARLYEGNFDDLLRQVVPDHLDLVTRSTQHRIDFIIDSIDEMPQQYLEGGAWRQNLTQFVACYRYYRLIYGSRYAELVGDPTAAAFHLNRLTPDDLKHHLIASGLSPSSFSPMLLDGVTSPFLLSLILEFGKMVGSARSVAGLLECAFRSYLARLPEDIDRELTQAMLRSIAHDAVMAGRETIPITDFLDRAAALRASPKNDPQHLLEALVRTGLFISEIESQVRFVHRSVTEYLCSSEILSRLTDGNLNLTDLLGNRRWDDPITWALSTVDPDDACTLLPMVYDCDPVLAFRIVLAAEQHREIWWQRLLSLIAETPPTGEDFFTIRDVDDYEDIPDGALPALRVLALSDNSEVRRWAWMRYAKQASDQEIVKWLDDAAAGRFDFNEFQWTARVVGEHLRKSNEPHFFACLAGLRQADAGKDIEIDGADAGDAAGCYAAIISGLTPAALERLLKWSSRQSDATRAIICGGVMDVAAPAAYRFLIKQLDRHFFPACIPLYLGWGLRRGPKDVNRPVPRFTDNRLAAIVRWMMDQKTTKWSLYLLHVYLDRSLYWREGVIAAFPVLPEKTRKAIRLVSPNERLSTQKRFISKMISAPNAMSELDRAVMEVLSRKGITLSEDEVLAALAAHGIGALKALSGWFVSYSDSARILISVGRMDEWVNSLALLFPRETWSVVAEETHLFTTLARAWSFDGRKALLRRANDSLDPAQDFILAAFVLRLAGFSMAEVSSSAAAKILEMYLDDEIEPFPSPGEVATDEFIEMLVLPRAEAGLKEGQYRNIELILNDAGNALGRRFHLPPPADVRRRGKGFPQTTG